MVRVVGKLDVGLVNVLNQINSCFGVVTTDSCSGLHVGSKGAMLGIRFDDLEIENRYMDKLRIFCSFKRTHSGCGYSGTKKRKYFISPNGVSNLDFWVLLSHVFKDEKEVV